MIDGLVVFFKTPRLGEVKSRLAATLGKEKALLVYQALLRRTLEVGKEWSEKSPRKRKLFPYGSGDPMGYGEAGFPGAKTQFGADLGIRMERAMREALRECDQVAIVGTDCPWITPDDIESAFLGLGEKETRLGPCPDGGYWLMSLRSLPVGCLNSLPWSESCTRARVASRMEGLGYEVKMLRELQDIDVEEDLKGMNLTL